MKKSKILILILTMTLLVGIVCAVAVPAAADSSVVESDWIEAPKNTLVKCNGGDCDHTECDYVYSFAVIGDTQNLNYIDAQNYTAALASNSKLTYDTYTEAHMRTLYNWILSNKDSKNIQYVMGLGDITQSFATSQTYYDEEWALAKEAISLLDGKLGYSLVRGNHDISSGLNGAFGKGTDYYTALAALAEEKDNEGRPMAGIRNSEKIEDTYRKLIIGDDKYIIFTLDYYPTDECVTWLNEMLTVNSDYSAIITLHAFVTKDRTFVDPYETTTPAQDAVSDTWSETATGGNVDPRSLWEKSLSLHANVKMVLSGHVDVDDVLVSQLKGVNGNTVTCMLIDGQTIDSTVEPVGLVTMFYISADGSIMNVEHISTVRKKAGKNAYLKEKNQFELTIDYSDENGEGWTSTAYGNIPTSAYNAHPFQIILDDDGDGVNTAFYWGGYDTWKETLDAIHAYNGIGGITARVKKVYNIIMTENCTFEGGVAPNKSGSNPGKIVLDINGKNLTLGGNGVLLPLYNNYNSFTASFVVRNGNITMAGTKSLAVLQTSIKDNGSVINLDFEDLNVTYSGSTASFVSMFNGYNGYKADVNLTVTDCDFDTTDAGGAVTLFNFNDTYNNNDVALDISGGSIIGTSSANLNLYSLNEGDDSVIFSKNSDENYTTISLTENVAPSGTFRNGEGKLLNFVTASTEAPYVFKAELAPIEETVYGDISTNTYPVADYPFVLFRNGVAVAGYASWANFCNTHDKSKLTEENNSVLYLRDSFNDTATSAVQNLHNVKNLTIDLGGKTLTVNTVMFYLTVKNNSDFTTNITVKNGNIIFTKAWAALIAFNSSGSTTSAIDARFNLTFEDVNIKASSTFKGRFIADAYSNGTYGSVSKLVFNDCTFDVTGAAVGNVSKLFQLEESSGNKFDVDVVINGGKFVTNSYITPATFSVERESGKGSPDSITFGKGSDGKSFCVEMPNTVAHPTAGIVTTEGTLYPIETVDDGTNSTYYFKSIITKYGTIDTAYLSEVDYPFALFKDGEMIHAVSKWNAFIETDVVTTSNYATGCTLLLRRDYTTNNANSQNLCYINDLVIDLQGNKFIRGSKHMFQAYGKMTSTTGSETKITVKNGIILTSAGNSPIAFNNSSNVGASAKFDFVFENVTFGRMAGSTAKLIAESFTNGTYGSDNTITLNNCTVSLVTDEAVGSVASSASADMFDLLDNKTDYESGFNSIAVTINGGCFKLANSTSFKLGAMDTAGDSVTFGKLDGENYTAFILPSGSEAPSVRMNDGELIYAKISDDGTVATYRLRPAEAASIDLVPKMSLTLDRDLILNVYVPAKDFLAGFTLDGTKYTDFKNLKQVTVDDETFYLISVPLSAKTAARDVTLEASVIAGDKIGSVTFTFGIIKYAEKILADGSEIEKALVCDVLSYVRAAYAYFDTDAAETLEKIDAILGESYDENNAPSGEGSASVPSTGLSEATFVLDGTPSMRFYLAEGANADAYKFYINGVEVSAVTGANTKGTYIDLDTYAYAVCETVTYTIDGVNGGSFHIAAYYEWSKSQNTAELENLVARFIKYTESAREYRNSVVTE